MDVGNAPVVILCGGRGARFDHESQVLPKPLIEVAGKPMLEHIMDLFIAQGSRSFYLPVGYLGDAFVDHFHDWKCYGQRFGGIELTKVIDNDLVSVLIVETGRDSTTGERMRRMAPYFEHHRIILTYGDGLADVCLEDLLSMHLRRKRRLWPEGAAMTVTAVRPPGRFGVIQMNDDYWNADDEYIVSSFNEKNRLDEWINGGFMVLDPGFLDEYCTDDKSFETGAMVRAAEAHQMLAYPHEGYWACMDTRRDLEQIEEHVRQHQEKNPGCLPWRYDQHRRERDDCDPVTR